VERVDADAPVEVGGPGVDEHYPAAAGELGGDLGTELVDGDHVDVGQRATRDALGNQAPDRVVAAELAAPAHDEDAARSGAVGGVAVSRGGPPRRRCRRGRPAGPAAASPPARGWSRTGRGRTP